MSFGRSECDGVILSNESSLIFNLFISVGAVTKHNDKSKAGPGCYMYIFSTILGEYKDQTKLERVVIYKCHTHFFWSSY